jgi:hypothetical protein
MQIYEFFDAVYGNWCESDIPMGNSIESEIESTAEEPVADDVASEISYENESLDCVSPKNTKMSRSFTHGMVIRHELKSVLANSNKPFREGRILEATYCATTGKLVDASGTKYNSISGFAKVNCILAKRPRSVNG